MMLKQDTTIWRMRTNHSDRESPKEPRYIDIKALFYYIIIDIYVNISYNKNKKKPIIQGYITFFRC